MKFSDSSCNRIPVTQHQSPKHPLSNINLKNIIPKSYFANLRFRYPNFLYIFNQNSFSGFMEYLDLNPNISWFWIQKPINTKGPHSVDSFQEKRDSPRARFACLGLSPFSLAPTHFHHIIEQKALLYMWR